jgi:hypothetical protein
MTNLSITGGTAGGPSVATSRVPISTDVRALVEGEWVPLPGGELEAPRVRALCPTCRRVGRRPLCLSCFKAERDRELKLKVARDLSTASEARFQISLPFEPVNRARLNHLRAARQAARTSERQGVGQFVDKRRQAQIAARHALQRLAEGLRARGMTAPARHPDLAQATHAAELPLPESWLPLVVSTTSNP